MWCNIILQYNVVQYHTKEPPYFKNSKNDRKPCPRQSRVWVVRAGGPSWQSHQTTPAALPLTLHSDTAHPSRSTDNLTPHPGQARDFRGNIQTTGHNSVESLFDVTFCFKNDLNLENIKNLLLCFNIVYTKVIFKLLVILIIIIATTQVEIKQTSMVSLL